MLKIFVINLIIILSNCVQGQFVVKEGEIEKVRKEKKIYHFTASGFLPSKKINVYEKCKDTAVKTVVVKGLDWTEYVCWQTLGIYCPRRVEFQCF